MLNCFNHKKCTPLEIVSAFGVRTRALYLETQGNSMSDDVGYEDAIKISFDQATDYLKRMRCNRPCEACGYEDFKIETDGSDVAYIPIILAKDDNLGLLYMPVSCLRCGNTRFINAISMARTILGEHTGDEHGE